MILSYINFEILNYKDSISSFCLEHKSESITPHVLLFFCNDICVVDRLNDLTKVMVVYLFF